jgi:hypothetical protein
VQRYGSLWAATSAKCRVVPGMGLPLAVLGKGLQAAELKAGVALLK